MAWALSCQTKMKQLSIRAQLTLLYSISVLATLTVLFASFYLVTKSYLFTETDRALTFHASQIAKDISLNTDNVFDSQTREILDVSSNYTPGLFLTATDTGGHNIYKEEVSSEIQDLANKALKANTPAFSYSTIGETKLRLVAFPITNNGAIGTVVMGHPIDVYEKALNQLKKIALVILLFLIAPSIVFGYLLSGNAVSSIKSLSQEMSKISSENLSKRVEIPSKSSEMFDLVSKFNKLLDRINEAFSREKQFIGEVAHEVKTPLAVIKSNAEITLLKDRAPSEYKKSLTQILEHVQKLTKQLNSLLDFAWSQTLDSNRQFVSVDLSKLLLTICEDTKQLAAPKNILVQSNVQKDLTVKGKEDKLAQVFFNLVDNAVKYTPIGGKIFISAIKADSEVIVDLKDTGVGIPKNEVKNIFTRFYRTDNSATLGHGLGLAIAHSIVTAHNGRIEVKSTPNKGSLFRVVLPI